MVLVYIRSRRRAFSQHGHPALTCLPNGEVMGNSFGDAGPLQQWDLETGSDPNSELMYVTLRAAANGKYLSATPHGTVNATADTFGDNEKWFVRKGQQDGECCVSWMSFHGRYLTNDGRFDCGKIVRADRDQVVPIWSQWMIVDDPQAMTCYSAGGNVRMVGAAVTTLFFPIVLGAVFITMNQRSLCYGGSDDIFSVMLLDEQKKKQKHSSSSTANEAAPELIWVPLKCTSDVVSEKTSGAAHTVSEASKGAAESIARTSKTVACSISEASSRTFQSASKDGNHDSNHNHEKERLMQYELQTLESSRYEDTDLKDDQMKTLI